MPINLDNVTNIMLGNTPVEQVTDSQGNVLWSAASPVDPSTLYFFVEDISGAANTLSIQQSNSNATTVEVFCSTDQQNWSSMGTTDTTPITATIPANGKLYLKATANAWGTNGETYNHISASYNHNIGGNAMSLIYGDNFENQTAFPAGEANFCGLFRSDTTLLNAENLVLPATTITPLCYEYVFNGCTSLLTSPTMSVTTLSHQCCWGMFEGCTNLTTAPVLLPTTLAETCYTFMFSGCNNLSSITTYAQNISADSCLVGWLSNVAATGDFYNLGGATYESGGNGIPSGWTEHNSL